MRPSVLAAAAAALALGAAASAAGPAAAQDAQDPDNTYLYASLGYIGHDEHGELGSVVGRIGSRWNFIGVEGEAGWGVNRRSTAVGQTIAIDNQQTVYVLGYIPVQPNIDLFGRVGYGRTEWNYTGQDHPQSNDTNWNLGGGGQWFFDPNNGLRAEYMYEFFAHALNANDWSISWVHRF
jgi:opacity protein-like surface antigen